MSDKNKKSKLDKNSEKHADDYPSSSALDALYANRKPLRQRTTEEWAERQKKMKRIIDFKHQQSPIDPDVAKEQTAEYKERIGTQEYKEGD